jgi:hypothetical protein
MEKNMKQPESDLSSFVFRSILKGLWWSATGVLIAIWIIITLALLIGSREFGSYDYGNPNGVNFFQSTGDLLGDIASVITGTVALTILGFITFGMPVTLFPSILGSILLAAWLYFDGKHNKLSAKKSEWKGMGIGFLGGLAALFIPYPHFGWPSIWLWFSVESQYSLLFWIISIVVPVFGAVTGRYLGQSLHRDLDSKGDYFSIDWEALKKDQQKQDLTSDPPSYDT